MNWLLPIMAEIPMGWTITFHRTELGITLRVLGWFPHVPTTSGERTFCHEYVAEIMVSAQELDHGVGDILQAQTKRAVRKVVSAIDQRRAEAQGGDA